MSKRRYPRSVSNYINRQKARIRKQCSQIQEQEQKIKELVDSQAPYRRNT